MVDLFNENTIKRMVENSNFVPSTKQKNAFKDWLNLLKENKLKSERSNNPKFQQIILSQLLNYPFLDIDFEKENVEFSFQKDNKIKVIIETKGTTSDLFKPQFRKKGEHSTPEKQIWDYMNKNPQSYGILTNYKIFVLYDYNEGQRKKHIFNFEDIEKNPNKLKEFILIFSKSNLIDEKKAEKLKQESEVEEKKFTDKFYKLFHETRLMMLKEFQENGLSKNDSLHYAQLFLNRLMFVFFAEDKNLIPLRILEKKIIKELGSCADNSTRVCDEIRVLFEDLEKGSANKNLQQFNGGLFKENISRDAYFKDLRGKSFFKGIYSEKKKLEENLKLAEEERNVFNKVKKQNLSPIIENILLMASYDFKSDLKVNILGHIFEQSLSDLEEIKNEDISKRKKEGIFYTPEYITDYICRNTIVPYLSKSGTNEVDKLIDEYSRDLEVLEEKFKKIKILDPACGSGAFLIKAVDVLFEIFEKVQKLKESYGDYSVDIWRKKSKKQITLNKHTEQDTIKEIIQNNIFGVDINEESIETTKLSLFLRIARRGKKLPDLSDNIKCGNSLIDDEEVAGDKAFKWEEEFPFKFDVVIGNPPYVRDRELDKEELNYLNDKFHEVGVTNLAIVFIKLAHQLIKEKGLVSMIVPKSLLFASNWDNIRNYISPYLVNVIDCGKVWKEVKLEQVIYIFKNEKGNKYSGGFLEGNKINSIGNLDKKYIGEFKFLPARIPKIHLEIGKKIKQKGVSMNSLFNNTAGVPFQKHISPNGDYQMIGGAEISREGIFGTKGKINKKWTGANNAFIKENSVLAQNIIAHLTKPHNHIKIISCIPTEKEVGKIVLANTINQLIPKTNFNTFKVNRYLWCLLNSNLLNWYIYNFIFAHAIRTMHFYGPVTEKIPIPKISLSEQKPFIDKADEMLKLNKEFYEKKNKFLNRIKELEIDKISKKLNKFYELSFADFLKELSKKKINLGLKDRENWESYFEERKKELEKLKEEIDETDKEIDKMVYKLYGLNEKEIGVVEGDLR